MCLLVFAFNKDPNIPLIVAGNRDEFHARPTQDAHWWPDCPGLLGGRDLQAGGTWLAIHRSGRFAAVTNFPDAQKETGKLRSRGHLVAEFLQSDRAPLDYLEAIDVNAYAGFNLLVSDATALGYLSNRGGAARELPPGIYGLGNAQLDEPSYKVRQCKAQLTAMIDDDAVNGSNLMRLLAARDKAPAAEVQSDRLSFSEAHALTAAFIVQPDYGTRCSTTLTVSSSGDVKFVERSYNPAGGNAGDARFTFAIGS